MGVKGFIEGGIASIVAGDLIKVRMQLQGETVVNPTPALQSLRLAYAFPGEAIRDPTPPPPPRMGSIAVGIRIVQQDDAAARFSVLSAIVLRQTLYSTTRMGLYDIMKNKWSDF